MKRIASFIVVLVAIFCLSACAPALQMGAELAGEMLWKGIGKTRGLTTTPDVSNVELLAKMDVNDYSIEIIRAKILPDRILFEAKKQGQIIGSFETNQAGFQIFTSATESDKKQFLRKKFLKYGGFDLGPVESASSLPTPGFAPTHKDVFLKNLK